ncbi:MAG: hypothetical protein HPY59_03850 [Anaerolineae bacterium]|nr:hypothetical protein [Anaerolineae bacterium]
MFAAAISLDITPEMVLRGQGANPAIITNRKPVLLENAERAIQEGMALLSPKIIERTIEVIKISHDRIYLENNLLIENRFITRELSSAGRISFIICTIGSAIEEKVSALYRSDPVLSLAFDGFGTAAIEALAAFACETVRIRAKEEDLCISIPYSPGMIEWPLEKGQNQIFSILQPDPLVVRLTPSFQMIPKKSMSMIIGIGTGFNHNDRQTCDFCAARQTCRYRLNRD